MADGKIKISELDEALQLSDNAEFPYTQDNGGVPTTFKAPANQIARKVAEGSTFTNLETTAKTLVGAINELSHLGNPILLGTTAPTSSQGADGNLYIQYTAGTGGADDEVDGIYVKIDGAWCEIQTGGGGGGAGGHTIVDDSGTALTQRTNLQFLGAYSEDNSTDDTTEVNVVREMTKAEYDELTEAEKTGFIYITDITGGNDDRFQPVIYSSEEREIGVWTDGKPLYEKVFTMNTLTVSSSWVNTTIDTTDIDTIASAFGIAPDGTFYSGLDGDLTASSHTVLSLRSYATSYIVKLILQYTKISDTAGSGQWTPQGVPAHHYSEDEQVVGTWIDGKPLYEKTIHWTPTNPIEPNTDTTLQLGSILVDADVCIFQSVIGGYYGQYNYISAWLQFNLGSSSNDTGLKCVKDWSKSQIVVRTGSNYGNFPEVSTDNRFREFYITVRYTKTST